jgi:hypothetical protein
MDAALTDFCHGFAVLLTLQRVECSLREEARAEPGGTHARERGKHAVMSRASVLAGMDIAT